jgi:hypothetical protein
MALLAAETADLGNRHTRDAPFGQGVLDVLELEVPDDRFNFLHGTPRAAVAVGKGFRVRGSGFRVQHLMERGFQVLNPEPLPQ